MMAKRQATALTGRRPMVVGSLALLPAVAAFAVIVSLGSAESFGWAGLALLPAGYIAGYVLVAFLVAIATVAFLSVLSEARVAGGGSRSAIAACCLRLVAFQGHVVSSFGLLRPALPRPPPMHIE